MNQQDPRAAALAEKRAGVIENAQRMYWMHRSYNNYTINVGVQLHINVLDQDQQVFDNVIGIILNSISLDTGNTDSLSARMAISNYIFDKLASGYINRDIHIEVVDSTGNKLITYYIYK
jgi:hypothetical protein